MLPGGLPHPLISGWCIAHAKLIAPLSIFGLVEGENLAQNFRSELKLSKDFDPAKMFGLLLVDGPPCSKNKSLPHYTALLAGCI